MKNERAVSKCDKVKKSTDLLISFDSRLFLFREQMFTVNLVIVKAPFRQAQ